MKLLAKTASLIVSVALVCLPVLTVSAAQAYRVEKLTVPADASENFGNRGILAQDDGSIDVFTLSWEKGKTDHHVLHHHSQDGGKTWKQEGVGWYEDCVKKYVGPKNKENMKNFDPFSMTTDGKGTFYFLAMTGVKDFDTQAYSFQGMEIYSLFKLSGGAAKPMVTFDQPLGQTLSVGRPCMLEYSDGTLAVAMVTGFDRQEYRFLLVDPDTGSVQYHHLFDGNTGMVPERYAKGTIYGRNDVWESNINGIDRQMGREPSKFLWIGFDTTSGKETAVLESPMKNGRGGEIMDALYAHCMGVDGTIYFTSSAGLYQLKAGGGSFTKLMEASASGLNKTRAVMHTDCGNKGDFYAVTCSNEESSYGKMAEILHYIPV